MHENNTNSDEKPFEELIKRCLAGDASQREMELVERWRDQRDKNNPFDRLSATEKETIRVNIFERLISRMELPSAIETTKRRSTRKVMVYLAASVITALCLFTYSHPGLVDTTRTEAVRMSAVSSTGDSKKIILSDSSIVWLK